MNKYLKYIGLGVLVIGAFTIVTTTGFQTADLPRGGFIFFGK